MAKKKKGIGGSTFTKRWVNRLLWFGCIWITWSYILASLDKGSIAEMLSQTVAEVIIVTVLGYLMKAYFETKAEKKNELEKMKMEQEKRNEESEDLDELDY